MQIGFRMDKPGCNVAGNMLIKGAKCVKKERWKTK